MGGRSPDPLDFTHEMPPPIGYLFYSMGEIIPFLSLRKRIPDLSCKGNIPGYSEDKSGGFLSF